MVTKIKPIIFILFLIISSYNCNNSSNNKQAEPVTKNTHSSSPTSIISDTSLEIGIISNIPDTIDGCGDFYSTDTSDIMGEAYIFLSSMRELAIINLNDNIIFLNKDSTSSLESPNLIKDVYKTKDIEVILDIKKIKNYSEGAFYRGLLIVKKGRLTKSIKIHGQTGC